MLAELTGLGPIEAAALALSLKTASLAVAAAMPAAILVGWLLARRRFWGHGILNAVVHLPLVLPPVVVGYLLLVLLGRNGPLGAVLEDAFGVRLVFATGGVVVACAIVGFPLFVRAVRQAVEAADPRLEQVARSLGRGEAHVFLTVTLPLMVPGVLAGATLAFARAVGEFGATITFAANIPGVTQTLPLALYTVLQTPGGEAAAQRLCALSILLAGGALAISEWLARRTRPEPAR